VHIFTCFYPVKLSVYLAYFWGIWKAEVVYLPRGNNYKWQRFLVNLFKRRSFKTIENIIDDTAIRTALSIFRSNDEIRENYSFCDRNFSITAFMRKYNQQNFNLESETRIVPLITDTPAFTAIQSVKSQLRTIVFMGNDMKRKNVLDVLFAAKAFPDKRFLIIGREDPSLKLKDVIQQQKLENVEVLGLLGHSALLGILAQCDLHFLPSRSEGFPRGIIEMAAAGIATITYHGYGADEWLRHGVNGFVVNNVNEAITVLQEINADSLRMEQLSEGAAKLAEEFAAEKIIRLYENIIEEFFHEQQ
jgi:glycosyltransferase involved in cell wall biosynthesis